MENTSIAVLASAPAARVPGASVQTCGPFSVQRQGLPGSAKAIHSLPARLGGKKRDRTAGQLGLRKRSRLINNW
jgi:hypothetical protein